MEKNENRLLAVAFILLGVGLFLNLGIFPLSGEDAHRATVALEMLHNKNLIVPTEFGELIYQPPVYNWALIGAFKVFGESSEWGIRFVAIVSLLLMGALTFWFVRKYGNPRLAIYSTLFLLTSAGFFFSVNNGIDLFYALLTYANIIAVFHFYKKDNHFALFFWACSLSAIGFLTRGLPALLVSIVTLSTLFFYKKQFLRLISWQHIAGIALFFVITGAYFYAYSFYHDPLNFFTGWWTQYCHRSVHTAVHPFLLLATHLILFPVLVIKDTFPASLFLLFLFRKEGRLSLFKSELVEFCVLIFIANLVMFWIPVETFPRYHYGLYPLLVIICTHLLHEFGIRVSFLKKPVYLLLIVILGKILFDIYLLPAKTGESAGIKQDAMQIAAITKGENLFLYRYHGVGTYPPENAFYLERERRQILSVKQKVNCEDYFIIDAEDKGEQQYTTLYPFKWEERQYYLVKFTGCAK